MSPRYSAVELSRLLGDEFPPTPQQAAVIEAPLSPTIVVAGAGSGKTATMAARVVWLIANGFVRPEHVLGLTFTRKAAAELGQRVRRRLARLAGLSAFQNDRTDRGEVEDESAELGEPTVSTYHSYAARVVGEHGLRAGLDAQTRMLSEASAWQLADSVVRSYGGDMSHVDFTLDTVVDRVRALAGELAEHLCGPEELRRYTDSMVESLTEKAGKKLVKDVSKAISVQQARLQLLPLVEAYHHRKRELGAADFADIMEHAARLAAGVPEVGATERDRYRVVLLDEYQDTSHAQIVLLRSLFGGGHPVTAVGDPCQSIYGWRGASSGTLKRFPDSFPAAENQEPQAFQLTISWRNRARILTVANAISGPLRDGGAVVAPLTPGAPGAGDVRCALLPTVADEAEYVADTVEEIWNSVSDSVSGGDWTETPPAALPSTAVLVRKRSQIPLLERALRGRGLPVEIVGVGGLLDVPEVREVYCTLRVLADPGAGGQLIRLLTGPRWRLGPRDLVALYRRAGELAEARGKGRKARDADRAEETALAEAIHDPGDQDLYTEVAWERIHALREEIDALRSRLGQPLSELIADIERTTGLDVEVSVHRGDRSQLDAFADLAAKYSADSPTATLTGFLAYLKAAEDTERGLEAAPAKPHPGAVQILTVHAAKGLEWDLVAVTGLSKGVFPGEKARSSWLSSPGELPTELRGDASDLPMLELEGTTSAKAIKQFATDWRAHDLSEDRRLAYVAFTRARHTLVTSGYWWGETSVGVSGPSAYLEELRSAEATVDQWAERPMDERNPMLENPPSAVWPAPAPLGAKQGAIEEAAALVMAMSTVDVPEIAPEEDEEVAAWAHEAELLLAERDENASGVVRLELPGQLSVSQLVALRRDPEDFAARLRRPLPEQPEPRTRRGTAFHAWVEEFFGARPLLDVDELPGAADDDAAPDEDLEDLKSAFTESRWAARGPVAVEVPFVTMVGGVPVRGRIDAVFESRDEEFDFEVVDWKTGRPPRSLEARRVAAVQLAAYRRAWAQLRGIEEEKVRACFHYVGVNRTVDAGEFPDLEELLPS
ncbi:ATP-dependent DNA helicase [Actinorhabdospora filicis]|uniref:DNA 3'-5' helicase n=1 Tax=Actinorhabdospora filicis TaxID=1785913 RepID=A0A9W6WCT6_9ACTN|nr:ATP-dependent DNA helicase [Actinorhabdospora filicis]GLZ81949.1 ATP-dependent DNA helicase [Actinorhabdospora filicis]